MVQEKAGTFLPGHPNRPGAVDRQIQQTPRLIDCRRLGKVSEFGKMLVIFGIVLVGLGLILLYGAKIPWLGKLPGDITIKRENFTFYFPLATSIILSIILTILLSLFRR